MRDGGIAKAMVRVSERRARGLVRNSPFCVCSTDCGSASVFSKALPATDVDLTML